MSRLRTRPKGAHPVSFGLFLLVFGFFPNTTGFQDIGALLARQPGVAERWQKQVLLPSIGAVQVATFNFARPIGTSSPLTAYERFANRDHQQLDVTGSISRSPLEQIIRRLQPSDFPTVNRTNKGDRIAPVVAAVERLEPILWADGSMFPGSLEVDSVVLPSEPMVTQGPRRTADVSSETAPVRNVPVPANENASVRPLDPELEAALKDDPLPQYGMSSPSNDHPLAAPEKDAAASEADATSWTEDNFDAQTTRLYFGRSSIGISGEGLSRWEPGAEPLVLTDPDIKVSSLDPNAPITEGISIAGKGEVTGEDRRPKTPSERLGLVDEKARAKAEKCLAEAVYFESRGEKVRGQIAVAQVVMNRVFSGYYPNTVCGVVYQNKHRHLACQFTFACDNVRDVIEEPDMWDRAKRIAKAMLDGQLWLPEVAKSTHYHAYWVRPSWVHEMKKTYKYGVHTFYRPVAWGDGSEAPSWGSPAQTAAITAELSAGKE
jgi:spore germination cell wall hydrolase CwlJ-like protein